MRKIFSKLLCAKLKSRRGSTALDYLLIIAVVAGVGFPVVMTFFGGPIQDSLLGQRQQLVTFLAQDRKQNVPSAWFSEEPVADPKEPGPLGEPGPLNDPSVNEPGRLGEPRKFNNPNIRQPGRLAANNVSSPGELREPGRVSGGGGGGGVGGSAGGAGAGSTGSDGMGPDFFNGNTATENGKTDPQAGAGSAYGKGSTGGSGGPATGSGEATGPGKGAAKAAAEKDGSQKSMAGGDAKKKMLDDMARAEEESVRKAKAFDWWLLIKIIVFVLIMFLILLIVLGNMRKR